MEIALEGLYISSGHVIHTTMTKCSRLHGHNWKVSVTIQGQPAPDGMILDFIDVKNVINEADHKIILPRSIVTSSPLGDTYRDVYKFNVRMKEYMLPQKDCYLIEGPVATAEHIAEHFAIEIFRLAVAKKARVDHIDVEIYETSHGVARIGLSKAKNGQGVID